MAGLLRTFLQGPHYLYEPVTNPVTREQQEGPSEGLSDRTLDSDYSAGTRLNSSWTTTFSALVCILSVIACLVPSSTLLRSETFPRTYDFHSPSRYELKNLRRPNQFYGLEAITRQSPPVPIENFNFPILVGRIDNSRRSKVIASGPSSRMIREGIEARKVEASRDISTVVQFRTIDWGMESCVLHISLPSKEDNYSSNSALELGDGVNLLNIHHFAPGSALDLRSLSFTALLPLGEPVASMFIDHGVDLTYHFGCAMDTLHAFVLVPANDEASIQWWQDKQTDRPAIYLIQHATK